MIADLPYEIVNGVPYTCFEGVKGSKLMLCHTMAEWDNLYALLLKQRRIACDTETTGFEWYKNDRIVGMSFGWSIYHFYVPVRHSDSITGGKQVPQLDMDVLRPQLQFLFAKKDLITIWQNAKFDHHMYMADGIEVTGPFHDTRIEWQFIDENAPGKLKSIASGWRDFMGLWHPGIVDKTANDDSKAISEWRTNEAKARRAAFTELISQQSAIRASEIRFQGWKKTAIKKWVKENDLVNHEYAKSGKEDVHYGYVPVVQMVQYAALDTFLTLCVHEHCIEQIQTNKKIAKLYLNELALSRVLFDSEETGMCINVPYLTELEGIFNQQIDEKRAEALRLLRESGAIGPDEDMNLSSADQLITALQKVGIEFTEMTKSNKKFKVDKKVLANIAKKVPAVQVILDLRKLLKMKDTYCEGIMSKLVNGNIIHGSFNQNVKTGRMSSQDPNLQNIPSRDKSIRKAFTLPGKENGDYIYVFFDYSQVEVRLTAHYSQDPILLDAYNSGQDVHLKSSLLMFGVDYEEGKAIYATEKLPKDQRHPRFDEIDAMRKTGKIINFGIIYGIGAPGLTQQIPRPAKYKDAEFEEWKSVCQEFIDMYFEVHKGVKRFVRNSNRFVKYNGWAENYFGRIRHLPHYKAVKLTKREELKYMEAKAQRQGTNFVIQGCQDPNAPVLTVDGYIPINKLLSAGKPALITYSGIAEPDYTVLDTGIKECVEVVTSISTGICSTEHKFFAYDSVSRDLVFKGIDTLKAGDHVVARLDSKGVGGSNKLATEAEAELIGVLIGDGSYGQKPTKDRRRPHLPPIQRNIVSIACGGEHRNTYASHVKSLVEAAFPNVNITMRDNLKKQHFPVRSVRFENKAARARLLALGLDFVTCHDKVIPEWIMTAPESVRLAVLRGLFVTDGGIYGKTIGFTGMSKDVVEKTHLLLLSSGIRSRFFKTQDGAYRTVIPTEYLEIFAEKVGFSIPHKLAHLNATKRNTARSEMDKCLRKDCAEFIYNSVEYVNLFDEKEKAAILGARLGKPLIRKHRMIEFLERLPKTTTADNFIDLLKLEWSVIKSITSVGVQSTMDLELHGDDHSYICRGLVQHNTAADVFKMACVKVHKLLKGKKSKMVCYVHDETHVYMHNDEVFLVPAIKYVMEDFKFKVPLIADCSISLDSWADKQPVDGSDLKKICAMANIEWTQSLEDQAQEALALVKSWKSGN